MRSNVETPSLTELTTMFVPTSGLVEPPKEIFPGGDGAMVNVSVEVAIAGDTKSARTKIFNTGSLISFSMAKVLATAS